jgi:peroxiredoxin Q/BCP
MIDLKPGDRAPDFDLPTDGGGRTRLSDYVGRTLVLYFYPKDDTPGCTTEAQGFTAAAADFARCGAAIVGVSKDSVKRHDRFKAKYDLGFTLASDESGEMIERYGVWVEKTLYGRQYMGIDRATFLVGPDGVIRRVWRKVRVPGHVAEVLDTAKLAAG